MVEISVITDNPGIGKKVRYFKINIFTFELVEKVLKPHKRFLINQENYEMEQKNCGAQ